MPCEYAPVCGGQVQIGEEQADRHALAFDGCAIHQLVLDDILGLVVCVSSGACRFSTNHRELHELYLDSHEEEINLAQYDILA